MLILKYERLGNCEDRFYARNIDKLIPRLRSLKKQHIEAEVIDSQGVKVGEVVDEDGFGRFTWWVDQDALDAIRQSHEQ